MIEKLQRKFMVAAMLSMLLVLTTIIGAINILNYQKVLRDADSTLRILSENNGRFPKEKAPPAEGGAPKPRRMRSPSSMSPELPYESRFFSVLISEGGTVLSIDTGKIAAVGTSTASEYALKAWESGKTTGFFQDYRYMRQGDGEHVRLTFLDCGRSLSTFRSFLFSSILVSALGLSSVLLLAIVFSKIAMRPVAESYGKQKQFITNAGHEIKTPLTVIDANVEIMELEYGENEWLMAIRRQTSRLAELTNALVYLSRMEEPGHQLQKIEFCLSDLVEETAQSFQPIATAQKKSLELSIAPLLPFYGDEASIRQLISILLDNALKHSPEHGSISVVLRKKGKMVWLSVRNESEPIPKEQLPLLFERFYRADASRNSESGGFGIGLSIAKAIVKAHKGEIAASCEDGHSLEITVAF